MAKKRGLPHHFIRAWRKHRHLTLEQLADRIGSTHATLSRVERGKLPYSQPLLEALADALNCQPADLIMRPPGSVDELREVLESLSPDGQKTATNILKALKDSEAA